MHYRILGPLEVASEGRTVDLGSSLERELLGILLVNANRVVSVDRLIDALWGPETPVRRTTLQVHVCNLRRSLQPDHNGDPSVIETRHPGYVLHVDAAELDATRFERRIDVARSMRHANAAGALARLDSAIGLWHGPALSDFDFRDWARPESLRLRELHLEALEERLELLLELGRKDEVLADATGLLAEHPCNERICSTLMVALYREGRQVDALEAYRVLRGELGESMGIEPSPRLRRLERQIVMQDPALLLGPAPQRDPTPSDHFDGSRECRRQTSPRHPRPGR